MQGKPESRYIYPDGKGWFEGNAWRMWEPVIDDEWITTVLTPVAEIRFCPFCGQKLEAPEEETSDERVKKYYLGVRE